MKDKPTQEQIETAYYKASLKRITPLLEAASQMPRFCEYSGNATMDPLRASVQECIDRYIESLIENVKNELVTDRWTELMSGDLEE